MSQQILPAPNPWFRFVGSHEKPRKPRFRATDEARWATPGLPAMAVAIWKAAILARRQP